MFFYKVWKRTAGTRSIPAVGLVYLSGNRGKEMISGIAAELEREK